MPFNVLGSRHEGGLNKALNLNWPLCGPCVTVVKKGSEWGEMGETVLFIFIFSIVESQQ